MFFCDDCDYMYNIAKNPKTRQVGGKVQNSIRVIIDKYMEKEPINEDDVRHLTRNNLESDHRYESLPGKDKKKLLSLLRPLSKSFIEGGDEDGSNDAYFICRNCKNFEKIKPGTVIHTHIFNEVDDQVDHTYDVYDPTLMGTRAYTCPNKACATHKKPELKDASLTKTSDHLVYICLVCKYDWIHEH